MQKFIKRPLSILLAALMLVSVFTVVPITASAADKMETVSLSSRYNEDYEAITFSSDHFLFEPGDDLYPLNNAWQLDGDYPDTSYFDITALNEETITKLVLHRTDSDNTPVVTVNGNNVSYTKSGSSFTFDNINASEVRISANGNYDAEGILDCYCEIESVDIYYSGGATAFDVVWTNWDGTVLETDQKVPDGTIPTYDGATPTKAETEFYTYTFNGWTPSVTAVTKKATYTATYTATMKDGVTEKMETISLAHHCESVFATSFNSNRFSVIPNGDNVGGNPDSWDFDGYDYISSHADIKARYGEIITKLVVHSDNDGANPVVTANGSNIAYTKSGKNFTFDGIGASQVRIGSEYSENEYLTVTAIDVYFVGGATAFDVVWKNWDGSVLETDKNVSEGTIPTYDGETPTRPSTDMYSYTFNGWTPEVVAVAGEATYTATFASTASYSEADVQKRTITLPNHQDPFSTARFSVEPGSAIFNNNGWELDGDYNDGSTISISALNGEKIVKAVLYRTEGDNYPIIVADGQTVVGTQNVNQFTFENMNASEFTIKPNENYDSFTLDSCLSVNKIDVYYIGGTPGYTVTWKNEDGTTLETDEDVIEGTMTDYDGSTPKKAPTDEFEYKFIGWDPEVDDVYQDTTYTAQYEEVPHFKITWKNENGSVIDSTYALHGVVPTHSTPKKAETTYYTYTFTGWTPEVVAATENAEYTATFKAVHKPANVVKGTYIRMGSYNGKPVDWYCQRINGTGYMMLCKYALKTSKFGSNATYKTSNIHSWLEGSFATDLGLTKGELSIVRNVNLSGSAGDGSDRFIIPAYANDELNKGQNVQAPYRIDTGALVPIYWLRTARDANNVEARVVNHSKDGSPVATVAARYSGVTNSQWIRPMFYLNTTAVKNLACEGTGTEADPYVFEQRYKVTSNVTPSGGGTVSATATRDGQTIFSGSMPVEIASGAVVTLTATPATGYDFKSFTVTDADGTPITVTNNKFTMPESAVSVTAEFEKQKFTLTWQNDDGTVIKTDENVEYGVTPAYEGEVPAKGSTAEFDYTFSGWSPEVTAVTADATYTASFNSTKRSYTITWKNGDDVLATDTVTYGETPVYTGETPARAEDNEYTYEFAGWSPEVTAVTGDAEYSAQFTSEPKPVSDTYTTEDGKAVELAETFTRDADDKANFGIGNVFKNLEILGVQKKLSDADESRGVRFVTVIDNEVVQDAEDYGYIAVAGDDMNDAREKIADVTLDTVSAKNVFTCKGTDNTVSGDYGKYSSDKSYKYVTFAINNIREMGVAVMFYLKDKNGNVYYAPYTNKSGDSFNNCAVDWAALTGSN